VDVKLIAQIQNNMNTKSTEELHKILDEHNKDEWSNEAFEAIQRILKERGENLSDQLSEIPAVYEETAPYKAERYTQMKPGEVLFSFDGRISRGTFLKWWPAVTVFELVGLAIIAAASAYGPWIRSFCLVTSLWPIFAILVKRWHDRNRSAWLLLVMITVVGIFWVLVETFALKGTEGANKFGPDPLGKQTT
jgi:uncharacterized membrane protein YhaH (DUF805 family)